jgi:spectinomycin phosphotransferase
MLEPPKDLHVDQIARALLEHWDIDVAEVSYVPLGAGSHNWMATDAAGTGWFVKSNRTGGESSFFNAAARTTVSLHEAGLEFVHAALRDKSGDPRLTVPPGWDLAVFAFIHGRNLDWALASDRALIGDAIGRLHASGLLPDGAPRWTPRWRQADLRRLLAESLDEPWTEGPYGEQARLSIRSDVEGIQRLLEHSDRLVAELLDDAQPWVMTHGEPTEGNSMLDVDGSIHLIDCDVMMVAPRERDLWLLLYGGQRSARDIDQTALAAYHRTAGPVEPRRHVLEVFRAERHLAEISGCAQTFAGPHSLDPDSDEDWRSLQDHIPIARLWPDLE